ncbi:MAG: asparagine synthetase B [Imperialibacter sp.]|uniref:Asparagine synthetase B n=1 Tax=Imperialibacter roseus TaxID=1324217 RepID=A0ABZ0IVQ3_9BACT|nr:asparagine synthetase B [Imperialibacter roseus]WOK08696.1 asparagine synthetase B [Imperialibacter roseus]
MKRIIFLLCIFLFIGSKAFSSSILIPMDNSQTNHLKSYGVAYWVLSKDIEIDWLLNYRGGSFMFKYYQAFENELIIRGVSYEVISDAEAGQILEVIASPSSNMDAMRLEKYPKIAVYSPKSKLPWDDAVTMVLSYAEIPYDVIFDEEILYNELPKYDWLHLHHEDFTGQYGKFYRAYGNYPWYIEQQRDYEEMARKHGFMKVSQMKLGVAKKIRDFVGSGGFLFAMCSATDSYDIALAAEGIDICESMYDGDPADPRAQQKLDFSKTFAFGDFLLERRPLEYEYSNIDMQPNERGVIERNDYFNLFEFSAKWDPIPTMLTQNHERIIKGFMGQTTAFRNATVKPDVVVMGENKSIGEVRYLHGIFGKGFYTFYGGHDPEDYQHLVGDPPTDLNLHPNSPGYRLILNNILFPAAKKKKQKT